MTCRSLGSPFHMFIKGAQTTRKEVMRCFLSDIHLLRRLRDPPSRAKSHYHQPFFILTMMLRQASALIREREREAGLGRAKQQRDQTWEYTEEATKWTTNHTLISTRWKTCFPSASKHIYASEHTLRRSFNNKSSSSLIMPNVNR